MAGPGPGSIIAIDVSGAPRFALSLRRLFVRLWVAFWVGACLFGALGFVLSVFPRSYEWNAMHRGVALVWILVVPVVGVFLYPSWKTRRRAGELRFDPYGVSYAEMRRIVKRLFRRSIHRHPRYWAALNFALALPILGFVLVNERDIVGFPYGTEVLVGGYLAACLFFMNGVRLFESSTSLAGYFGAFILRVGAVVVFLLLCAGALLAYTICLILLYALIWYGWSLLIGRPAPFTLEAPELASSEASAWIVLASIFAMSACWVLFRNWIEPAAGPRAALVERTIVKWWRSVTLPSADLVQRRDRRSPVLFLRSFHDDVGSLATKGGDYERLEEVIGPPLRELGPLLGIGKPGELAFPGAARAYYSDDQWQEAVASIMGRASFIVAVVGWTNGLQWEVETIKTRGYLAKSIWLLPPVAEHHDVLCDWLRAIFRATPYEHIVWTADLRGALAVHPEVDGRLVVISGANRDAGEYEAAIQTAVYGMMRHLVPDTPLHVEELRGARAPLGK